MNSKISSNKPGMKSTTAKPDHELERLRKENAALKKRLEEASKSKVSETERKRLLETILDLETEKVKHSQDLDRQDRVLQSFKDTLSSRYMCHVLDVANEARELEAISQVIREQLPGVLGAKAREQKVQDSSKEEAMNKAAVLEAQLKDALEKNQQWLVYDQQREAFVQGLMVRIRDLEQQIANVKQTEEQAKESNSDAKEEEKQKFYDRLLLTAKKDLEGERQISGQLNSELSALRTKYEDKKKEVGDLSASLDTLRETERQRREEERKYFKDKMQKLKVELNVYRDQLQEEKKKNSELSSKVEVNQTSVRRQNEDKQRMAALEEQIQRCTLDFENEKLDRQSVQHQLNKVLKELRKTQEQITKMEPVKRDIYYVDTSCNHISDFNDKLTVRDQHPSPRHSLMDESFLECPQCHAVYPTSQHRELLAHIDFCTS